jgi:hypothetical protein
MKRSRAVPVIALVCLLALASLEVLASEMVGIYAVVEKVVFEPNERSPERIQIWGVLSTERNAANPRRGYLYFRLPSLFFPEANEAAKKEWADLKAVAGTGQPIAFGRRFFPGVYSEQAIPYRQSLGRVRPASVKPSDPEPYPVNIGVSKLTDATIVGNLKKAL